MGEDVYTPGNDTDALRYMYDPALGDDYDRSPDRNTGTADNGGVHWNSGIANLTFFLLSVGGTHTRGKTSIEVDGITKEAAADIFILPILPLRDIVRPMRLEEILQSMSMPPGMQSVCLDSLPLP